MKRGFSLVELSIVLVILGLLVGGILSGQSLIRAAELRSVTTEYQKYSAAVNTFKDKYFAIPGEMTTATSFWGKDNASCPGDTGTAATPGTCNGNGNGIINIGAAGGATAEIFRFFQQLQLAGLLEGSYTGISGAANGYTAVAGTNVPKSKLSNAAWHVYYYTSAGDTVIYATEIGNFFGIGAISSNTMPQGKVLKPEEAWNIDTKMDDGKPATGSIIAAYWNNACAAADDGTSANNDLVASYRLSDTTAQCALYFRKAF